MDSLNSIRSERVKHITELGLPSWLLKPLHHTLTDGKRRSLRYNPGTDPGIRNATLSDPKHDGIVWLR